VRNHLTKVLNGKHRKVSTGSAGENHPANFLNVEKNVKGWRWEE